MVEYGILGPLLARVDGVAVDLGGARTRAVLAVLLLERNTVVSVDRLVDLVWGEEPPATAETALQGHVSRLRQMLGPAAVETRPPGYLLRVVAGDVDVERFDALVARARGAPPPEAGHLLREALGLWRGTALADLADEPFAEATVARLEGSRIDALEARIEADLGDGRQQSLVGELEALIAEHPYRERLHGLLMLALYRSGRQAEALAAYRSARMALDEGLGIDPGPELQALELRILNQDPALAAPTAAAAAMTPESVPAEPPTPAAPPTLAAPTVAGGVSRKTVTVVFADVAGSTSLGEQLDPEMMRALMSRYFAAMKTTLERHGGTVEKFIGDAVMAVFGIPALHEDDALRAVRAAEEMQATLARFSAELEAQRGISLRTRVGVNTGEVVAGDPTTGQTLVTGDAVNVAARLEQAAGVGEVLIGATTYRLVRDAVVVEGVEPLTLKGKQHPVPAYRVLSVTPGADPLARRQDTALVGRDRELSRIHAVFEDVAAERQCHVLTLLGAAGVGKTRLVAELARLVGPDATVLRGRCLSYGEGITFWPVREMVTAAAGFSDRDDADTVRERIAALVAGAPDADVVTERVCQVLGLSADQAPRNELFWALRRLFAAIAVERPAIVVFDDLQWAEPTLLDLIEHLAEEGRDAPILLVCIARPEIMELRPAWGGGQLNATSVMLEALVPVAARRLLNDMVGEGTLPDVLLDRLVGTAEGNPLFLQELIAGLIDDGMLRRGVHGWEVQGGVDDIAVPPTIAALMAARLDHLGPVERVVLGYASVVGRSFERDALLDLLPPETGAEVDTTLRSLARAGLLRPEESRIDASGGWRFRHLLTRDLSYAGLPKETRAALHERFASWLQQQHAGRIEEFEEILGYHLEQAYAQRRQLGAFDDELRPMAEHAARWLTASGKRALARHDGPAAESLLGRAAALLPPSGEPRLSLELFLAELHRGRGDLAGAGAALEHARAEAQTAGLSGVSDRASLLLAWLHSSTEPAGWLLEADRVTRAVEPRLTQAADDEGLSLLWGLRMDAAMAEGHVRVARTAAERAIGHGSRSGDAWQVTRRARANLAELSVVDDTPVAVAEARCVGLLEAVGHERRLEASILFSLARLQAMRGDDAAATTSVTRGLTLADELGLLYGKIAGAEAAAFVAAARGDFGAADELLGGAHQLVVARGDLSAATRIVVARAEVRLQGWGRGGGRRARRGSSEQRLLRPTPALRRASSWRASRPSSRRGGERGRTHGRWRTRRSR